MAGIDSGTAIIFGLGVLVGGLLFNKEFRYKFFKGFRSFLGNLGKGAREQNARYSGRKFQDKRDTTISHPMKERHVEHIYKEIHKKINCPLCNGTGKVFDMQSPLIAGAPGIRPKPQTCPECEGTGKVWDD